MICDCADIEQILTNLWLVTAVTCSTNMPVIGYKSAKTWGAFKLTRFATVSGLNDIGFGVKNVSPISSNIYKPRGIKETARTMGPSEVI